MENSSFLVAVVEQWMYKNVNKLTILYISADTGIAP